LSQCVLWGLSGKPNEDLRDDGDDQMRDSRRLRAIAPIHLFLGSDNVPSRRVRPWIRNDRSSDRENYAKILAEKRRDFIELGAPNFLSDKANASAHDPIFF
jgi:hypothetical protein